jgi:hypothetical protein
MAVYMYVYTYIIKFSYFLLSIQSAAPKCKTKVYIAYILLIFSHNRQDQSSKSIALI